MHRKQSKTNTFKLSITNLYEKLKRSFAISAFISLENFVTSGKIARGEQIVMKRVTVVVSKQNNTTPKTKKHQTTTALSRASKN